ncbi:hypothetical protein BLOT_010712 [Blomia tropicalis]|nr:hypothetical protein BLOT_010712 [Blomia tropicalis]
MMINIHKSAIWKLSALINRLTNNNKYYFHHYLNFYYVLFTFFFGIHNSLNNSNVHNFELSLFVFNLKNPKEKPE